jgi:hypothetical protein
VQYQGNQNAGTANFSVSAPAHTNPWITGLFISNATVGGGNQVASTGNVDSPTLSTNVWAVFIDGEITFTAAGTFALQVACSNAADTFSIQNAKFELTPAIAVAG